MKGKIYLLTLLIVIIFTLLNCSAIEDNRTPKEIGSAIADKIIRETKFEYKSVPFKPSLGIQVLDYKNEFDNTNNGTFISITNIISDQDTAIKYGISYSGKLNIYINNNLVLSNTEKGKAHFIEYAYNMFSFQDSINVRLKKGENTILVELEKLNSEPLVFIREIPDEIEALLSSEFELNYLGSEQLPDQWYSLGPLKNTNKIKSEILSGKIREEYIIDEKIIKWQKIKEKKVEELVIPESNSYTRESYLEWHYANGTLLFGLQSLAAVSNQPRYSKFVGSAINYTLDNYDKFKSTYYSLHAFRGPNYRMFRKTMLDDTGAPALPYLNSYLMSMDEKIKPLVNEMDDYLLNKQVRLDDGTFCRPEPVARTVWADDLFMSVPYLVRLGKLNNDERYFNDATLQIINFNKYLFNKNDGLYKHGWFGNTKEKSIAYWGRANGWIIWATSEALLHIPKTHKDYEKIENIFKEHLEGIIKYQSATGMWHQILDKPESFKETSCTAMFIIGILRGVENGWIEKKYKDNAMLAWNELKTKITKDGTVKDICRGTGIGYDLEFYFNRKRFDNDPRGLGAILTATAEMIKVEE